MFYVTSRLIVGMVIFWPTFATAEESTYSSEEISRSREIPGAQTYMVPMRDGTKLATDVSLPKGKPGDKWAAILVRTPYNRRGLVGEKAAEIIPKLGFAMVVQDLRGRFGSEGEDFPIHGGCGWFQFQDGYDTIEWVARQPWCNGKVGTVGPSAMGLTQNLTMPTQPPHLVCAFVMVAPSDMYSQATYWGGAPRKVLADNWVGTHGVDPRNLDLFRAHPCCDELWDSWNIEKRASRVNVPAVYYGGWYDMFCQGTINTFVEAQARGGPNARGKCRLIMGPWEHNGLPEDLAYPENAKPKFEVWAMQWFMRHLKGTARTGGAPPKAVNYYVMGASGEDDAPGNVWRSADAWPPPSKNVNFYLHKGGKLSADKPSAVGDSASYRYDPRKPVPTLGGSNLTIKKGPVDQRPAENRPDVLLFTTPVLSEPVEATGRITVKLWASSSCRDTDFAAKLCDVYPDGRSMLVLDGIVRARYRESFRQPTLMQPGKAYAFEIDLWSTSIIFNKGHKIRVAISSSNAPRFGPNPNTGQATFDMSHAVVAENTIHLDRDRPSHIVLPRPVEQAAMAR